MTSTIIISVNIILGLLIVREWRVHLRNTRESIVFHNNALLRALDAKKPKRTRRKPVAAQERGL